MYQGGIGRQDGKGTGTLARLGQLQYQVIPTDQQIGFGVLCQFEKHLVIRVPAFGQEREVGIARLCRNNRQMRPVAFQQIVATGGVEAKLRVSRDSFQFGQRVVICQADHLTTTNRLRQLGQGRRLKMKQIHHHVRIQYQSGWCRYD